MSITYTMRAHSAISDFLTRKLQGYQPTPQPLAETKFTEVASGTSDKIVTADLVEHSFTEESESRMQNLLDQFNSYKTMYLRTVQSALNEPATIPADVNTKIDTLTKMVENLHEDNIRASVGKVCVDQRVSLKHCYDRNTQDPLVCQPQIEDLRKCISHV